MLLRAAVENNLSRVKSLLFEEKVNPNTKGDHEFTALHLASRAGNIDIIKLLLLAKADINALNKNNNTPLHSASYGGKVTAIEILVNNGALLESRNKNGDTPLHSASWKGEILAVQELVEQGADLEAKNDEGDTPLHLAAWQGNLFVVDKLITYKSNILAKNNEGLTALELAEERGHILVIKMLTNCLEDQEVPIPLEKLIIETIYTKIDKFKKEVIIKTPLLRKILSDYQPYNVTDYEVERVLRTMEGIKENNFYLYNSAPINSAAVMLPSNLPLYSLTVFALIPSFLSKNINIRPNALLQEHDIISRICFVLEIETIFPNVHIINTHHKGFKKYIKEADLVVFTGKPSNADKILIEMKESSLLVINGAGHNPVVVTESADLDKAIEGSLLLKGFNGGQDCAGPDAILIHQSIAGKFLAQFQTKFSALKTGKILDEDTTIGPIHRLTELQRFAKIFHNNSKDIITGGIIDFKEGIVLPTIIVRGIERYPNYKEMFGPIAFIHPYENDQDLSYYFQDINGQYCANRMYVTVYGHSTYLANRDDSLIPGKPGNVGIILYNQTIHDIEIGFKEYGGYSLGASGVIKKSPSGVQRAAMPILIPKVITEYIIKDQAIPRAYEQDNAVSKSFSPSMRKREEIEPIVESFQKLVKEVFAENLVFGFIFGSAAKGKLKIDGHDQDDLDTFICLHDDDYFATAEYIRCLARLHQKYKLKVDETFPAEIVTIEKLTTIMHNLSEIVVSVDNLIHGQEFDHIFWVHALTDRKVGFLGNGKVMAKLIQIGQPYIYKWRDDIIQQLVERDIIPEYLHKRFSGLSKVEIVEKLSKFSAHLVVHLGLNYDDKVENDNQNIVKSADILDSPMSDIDPSHVMGDNSISGEIDSDSIF